MQEGVFDDRENHEVGLELFNFPAEITIKIRLHGDAEFVLDVKGSRLQEFHTVFGSRFLVRIVIGRLEQTDLIALVLEKAVEHSDSDGRDQHQGQVRIYDQNPKIFFVLDFCRLVHE